MKPAVKKKTAAEFWSTFLSHVLLILVSVAFVYCWSWLSWFFLHCCRYWVNSGHKTPMEKPSQRRNYWPNSHAKWTDVHDWKWTMT